MRFFDVLRSSTFDPAFYAGMKDRLVQDGAKYYFALALVIVFVFCVPLWALILMLNGDLLDKGIAAYPDGLEIYYTGSEIHTNQPEPYKISNPFLEQPANLAVFDTGNDEYSPEAFRTDDTLLLFKKTFGVALSSQSGGGGDQRVFSYGTTSVATTTLDKAVLTTAAAKIKPYIRPVAVTAGAFLFVLAVIFGAIAMLVFHLCYLLFPALLIYFYFRIARTEESFHTAYVTALFASIPVAIVSAAAMLLGGLPSFIYTLLLLLVVGVNRAVKQGTVS